MRIAVAEPTDPAEGPAEPLDPNAPLPRCDGAIRLVGALANTRRPDWSFAAITDATGKAMLYREGMQLEEEGCLSVPGFNATVARPSRAILKGLNRDGEEYTVEATGLLARCFQHEMDHLDGTLFVDRLRGLQKDIIVRKIKKLARAGKW